ncbi:MAG: hypothetical protein IBJ19_05335 [Gemmatimonadaceae bacterium]|nr:hypothetical protein [Gemmatimonadaceae bacterium]
MTGTDASLTARAALDAARRVFSPDAMATSTAPVLWDAAQVVLQRVVGRPELTGQALVGEARRLGVLTISDAHALVGLSSWADRSDAPATTESERILLREAWMALEHAVPDSAPSFAPPPYAPPSGSSATASFGASPAASSGGASTAPPHSSHYSPPPPPPSSMPPLMGAAASTDSGDRRRLGLPPLAWLAVAVLVLAAAIGGGWWWQGRADRAFAEASAAYRSGNTVLARGAMADMARRFPNDARPLVYLGRLSRDDGDLPRARRFLTTAVELAPNSAIASRELASLMLTEGQPEIARRFYVRALQIDPADRVAQGFLACALHRLQRFDEARRWYERAGPGEWQGCLATPPLPPGMLPQGMMPPGMMPPGTMPPGAAPRPTP